MVQQGSREVFEIVLAAYPCVYSTTSFVTGLGLKSHSILVGSTRALPALQHTQHTRS